ncbi:MAG: hypothetical protein VX999_02735, partial [Candidatus Thermoplasmatota archaeon]|nr:hypothetical protein [Candidatus Thermoplasmatota archaeon]
MEGLGVEIESDYPQTGQKPSPCLLVATEEFPESWYWEAVREEVSIDSRLGELPESTRKYSLEETPIGVVGASSAIA